MRAYLVVTLSTSSRVLSVARKHTIHAALTLEFSSPANNAPKRHCVSYVDPWFCKPSRCQFNRIDAADKTRPSCFIPPQSAEKVLLSDPRATLESFSASFPTSARDHDTPTAHCAPIQTCSIKTTSLHDVVILAVTWRIRRRRRLGR